LLRALHTVSIWPAGLHHGAFSSAGAKARGRRRRIRPEISGSWSKGCSDHISPCAEHIAGKIALSVSGKWVDLAKAWMARNWLLLTSWEKLLVVVGNWKIAACG